MVLWDSPVYRFRVPVDVNDPVDLKEVVVDVTGSAPPFKVPSENLKEVLEDVFCQENGFGIETVLEFGAAKLKNTPYILGLGKKVCAVKFESLTENKLTQENIQLCRQFGLLLFVLLLSSICEFLDRKCVLNNEIYTIRNSNVGIVYLKLQFLSLFPKPSMSFFFRILQVSHSLVDSV